MAYPIYTLPSTFPTFSPLPLPNVNLFSFPPFPVIPNHPGFSGNDNLSPLLDINRVTQKRKSPSQAKETNNENNKMHKLEEVQNKITAVFQAPAFDFSTLPTYFDSLFGTFPLPTQKFEFSPTFSSSSITPSSTLTSPFNELELREEPVEIDPALQTILDYYKELTDQECRKETGVSFTTLQKVVNNALTFPMNMQEQSFIIQDNSQFFVERENNTMKMLCNLSSAQQLGSGTFGNVQKVRDLIRKFDFAIKFATFDPFGTLQSDTFTRMGYDILTRLNSDGQLPGTPETPFLLIDLYGSTGYGMQLGLASLKDYLLNDQMQNEYPLNILSTAKELAYGIKAYVDRGFIHNDIKLENMMVWLRDGQPVVTHSDLDGGYFFSDLQQKNYIGTHTEKFFPENDKSQINNYSQEEDQDVVNLAIPDFHERQMVYALGCAMQEWTSSKLIFILSDIFNQMVLEDIGARPSIDLVITELDKLTDQDIIEF